MVGLRADASDPRPGGGYPTVNAAGSAGNWDDRGVRSLLQSYRALPLATRWLLTIIVYAAVVAAIVLVVRSANSGGGASAASRSEAAATAEANREGRIAIAEDEAPHSAKLSVGLAPQRGLERAVAVDVRARIAHGELTGPLQSVSCKPAGAVRGGRQPLECSVRSAGIVYPFVGVLDRPTDELTWCKEDPPPTAGAPLEVPVSARCRA
jgi:hypothetical protein